MLFKILNAWILLLAMSIHLSSSDPFKIVCYFSTENYDENKFSPESIDPSMCTHINYGFATLNDVTSQIDFGNKALDVDDGNLFARIISLKDKNPDLKVILSLGGWNDSTRKYSDLVSDTVRRAHFVSTTVPFLQTYGFDGLDVAWEYPNCWQGDCGVNPDDVANFVSFLSDLRSAFDPVSLILTASVSAVREEIDEAYDVPNISKFLDHINVMSYDFHGGWEKNTGHHSQFDRHPEDIKPSMNLNSSINHWIYRGMDKTKLVIGIPSYGRSFTLVNPRKYGLNAPALGPGQEGPETNERGLLSFHEICRELDSWYHIEDDIVGSYSVRGDQWVGFDSPRMVVRKTRLVLNRGLGGISYKSFYTDDHKGTCFQLQYPILKCINYALTVTDEKDFETNVKNIRTFMQKLQLSILVDDEKDIVDRAERKTGASDEDVYVKLYETENTSSGDAETKMVEVNAGTLAARGDMNGRTLALMDFALGT